ncbi:OmpA/MotB family protein [Bdellovibrio bacteriovorus]|uniref:Flagellar motor protein MotB n=1 Tax=Bdellovibrio bacteriovorus TaxID=959 RepID=A0A1Z3NC32_BDEBC|nr:flagellar motor protein MotB [Bdellovibrio bacteriovorus]ASD65030.1 flagellar motor protein MotB [Bdellovibrio bacteriovorus]
MSGSSGHRRRKPHEEPHTHNAAHDESNWLVSYADMMTLLFGFFVLMYSMSRFDSNKFDLVSKEIAKYFGGNVSQSSLMIVEQKIVNILKGSGEMQGVEISRGNDPNTLALKFDGSVLFESGAVDLKPAAAPTLNKVVAAIKSVKGVEKISIEGHTDNDPFVASDGPIRSNWELSALRASSVLRYFEERYVDSKIMSATGYGQTRPLKPNQDEKGADIAANKAENRRVIVTLTLNDAEAAYKLQQKQFTKKLTAKEVEEQKREAELQERMKNAQAKYQQMQEKYKAAQEEKRKQQQLERMEKQIRQLEKKTEEFQKDLTQ